MNYAINHSHPGTVSTPNNTKSEKSATPGHSSDFSASAKSQPKFDANTLQSLLTLLQQLLQLINKEPQHQQPNNKQPNTSNPKQPDSTNTPDKTDTSNTNTKCDSHDADENSPVSPQPRGPELSLSDKSNAILNKVVLQNQAAVPLTAFDNDNDGRISVGDVITDRSGNQLELTAGDVKKFEDESYGPDLNLSPTEISKINGSLFGNIGNVPRGGTFPPLVTRVFDSNGDGKLSAGDILERKSNPPNEIKPPPDFQAKFSYTTTDQNLIDQINGQPPEVDPNPNNLPDIVSSDGASVGASLAGQPIPNNKVVNINGQDYTVGFLKQQVDAYANADPNSFGFTPPPGAEAQVVVQTDWGTGSTGSRAARFEAYISNTFPNGEPN